MLVMYQRPVRTVQFQAVVTEFRTLLWMTVRSGESGHCRSLIINHCSIRFFDAPTYPRLDDCSIMTSGRYNIGESRKPFKQGNMSWGLLQTLRRNLPGRRPNRRLSPSGYNTDNAGSAFTLLSSELLMESRGSVGPFHLPFYGDL